MYSLMRKNVAIDAEMIAADLTSIPATFTDTLDFLRLLGLPRCLSIQFRFWDLREGGETGVTSLRLRGLRPRNFDPVPQGKEMMIRACQVRGENECQAANWAFGGKTADFAFASGTKISATAKLAVAGAKGHSLPSTRRSGWKAHH